MGSAVSSALSAVGQAVITVGVFTMNPMMVLAGATMVAGATALAPRPDVPSLDASAYRQQLKNTNLMQKQSVTVRETVYGSTKKSGAILYMDATDNNKRLHMIIELASHEIQSIDKVYFDNDELTLTTINTDANSIARQRPTAPAKSA